MIEIKDIDFAYAGSSHCIFDGFSLSLEANNIYGLLGKNGTGKSTLLYLISGLLRPQSGTVTIDGTKSSSRHADMLGDVFIVPEEFDLPTMTLDKYVELNQPFYPRFSREVLDRCLADFDLPLSLRLDRLSMGQKKKVYMSFALASGTRLLLMDEPTNGLDIPSKSQFRRVVMQNMTPDRTLVISTHQVHDIEQLLNHIVIIDRSGMLLNESVAGICRRYVFGLCKSGEEPQGVVYAEPTLMGNAFVAKRTEDMAETPLNLELLFNAVVDGAMNIDAEEEVSNKMIMKNEQLKDKETIQ